MSNRTVKHLDLEELTQKEAHKYQTVGHYTADMDFEWPSFPIGPKWLRAAADMMEDAKSDMWVPTIVALEVYDDSVDYEKTETLAFVNEDQTDLVIIAPRTPEGWEVQEE